MVFGLWEEEVKKMNKELLDWVTEVLDSDDGTYVYNILQELRHLIESKKRT